MLVEKSSNGNQKGGFTISYIGMKELEGFPKSVGAEWWDDILSVCLSGASLLNTTKL